MSENLEFKIQTNWDEISKLRDEIRKLELSLESVGSNTPTAEIDQLSDDLRLFRNQMKELVKENVALANSYDGELKNSVTALKGYMHDLSLAMQTNKEKTSDMKDKMKALKLEMKNFGKDSDQYQKLNKQMNILQGRINAVETDTRQLNDERIRAKQIIETLQNKEEDLANSYADEADEIRSASMGMQGTLMSMATKFAGGYGLFQFIDKMKSTRAEFQNMEAAMTTIVGKGTAGKLMEELKELAKQSPLSMQAMVGAEKMMLSFGISSKDSTKYLKALSDVSMGQASNFNSLSLAFSQMSSAGKLMGQDLMQMVNAGFNPLEEISRKTGKSIGALKEEMSKGAISAKMVQEAFISATEAGGKFCGMSEATASTISGQLSMLEDAWDNLFNDLGQKTEGLFIGSIQATTKLVENFDKVGIVIGSLIGVYGALKTAELIEITLTKNLNVLKAQQIIGLHANASALKSLSISQQATALKTIFLTKAQTAYNAVLMACPYLAILGIVVALGTAIYAVYKSLTKATEGQRMLNESIDGVVSKTNKEVVELEVLKGRLKNCEEGTSEYYEVKRQLESLAQKHNVTLDEENVLLTENAKCWDDIKKAMLSANATAGFKTFKEQQEERVNKNLESYIKEIKDKADMENADQRIVVDNIERILLLAKATGNLKKDENGRLNTRELLDEQVKNEIKNAFGDKGQSVYETIFGLVGKYIREYTTGQDVIKKAEEKYKELGARFAEANNRTESEIIADIEQIAPKMRDSRAKMDGLARGTKEYEKAKDEYLAYKKDYEEKLNEYSKVTGKDYDKDVESISAIAERISRNKKLLDELRKQMTDATKESEIKMLEARIKDAETRINADKTAYKQRTGKDYDKLTEDDKAQIAKSEAELRRFRAEQAEKQAEQAFQDQRKIAKAEIDAMEEGYEKVKKQREYQREGEMHELDKNAKTREKALIADAKREYELQQNIEEQKAKREGRAYLKKSFSEEKYKQTEEYKSGVDSIQKQREAEERATKLKWSRDDKKELDNTLKQYETFQQKRVDIAKKYAPTLQQIDEEIGKAMMNGDLLAVENLKSNKENVLKAKGKELMTLGTEELKQGGLYDLLFSDLANASTDALQLMEDKLKEFGATIPDNLDPADIKAYKEALQKLKDELYSRQTDQNIFQQMNSSMEESKQTKLEEDKAYKELEKANQERKKAQKQLEFAEARVKRAQELLEYNPDDPNVIKEATNATNERVQAEISLASAEKKVLNATANYTTAVNKNEDANNKLLKTIEKAKKNISDFSKVAEQAGEILGEEGEQAMNFIASIGDFANSILSAVELTARGASEAISAAERASAILAIVQAALKIMQQIEEFLPNSDREYDKKVEKQKELNALVKTVNDYKRAVLEAQLAEKSWFASSAVGNLQDQYALGLNALENYYSKAYELQKTYKDKEGKVKLSGKLLTFGIKQDDKTNTMFQPEYKKAIENLRMEIRSATEGSFFHKARAQKTQSLQEWIDEKLGEEFVLFDEDGLINLELATSLLENYGDKMVGETKETIEALVQAREEYDAYLESLRNFVSESYSPLTDDLTNAVLTWLDTGEDALSTFQESASSTFRNIAQDMLKQLALNTIFDGYQDDLTNVYKDYNQKVADLKKQDITSEEYNRQYAQLQNELAENVAKVTSEVMDKAKEQLPAIQDAAKMIDEQLNTAGIDISKNELTQEATAGGFKTMSEDTANELNGRFTAVYEGELRIESAMSLFTATMQSIATKGVDIAVQTQEILASSYLELQEISSRVNISNTQLTTIANAVTKIQKEL